MARVRYSPAALIDLERLADFAAQHAPDVGIDVISSIRDAISVLKDSPYIGRPVSSDMRELIISQRRRGYVALYRVLEDRDLVSVLKIRHQRESGFADHN